MTQQDKDPPNREAAGQQRIAEITELFVTMRAVMVEWLKDAGPPSKMTSKQMLLKVTELQTAHLLVVRAEEAFHEKFGHTDIPEGIDYEAARNDIGGALDRLRGALAASGVSEGADA